MDPNAIPPIGPALGVSARLDRCPLCGGPNPHHGVPPPLPAPAREPTVPSRTPTAANRTPPVEGGALQLPVPSTAPDLYTALDHPEVGGRFTVFVLCYGDYPDLARRCVRSVLATLPAHRLDLRLIANAPSAETTAFLSSVPATRLYLHAENRFKYPAMREAFRDPSLPIRTPYTVWFDDDSHVRDPLWAVRLAEAIAQAHPSGAGLYGIRFCHDPAACAAHKGLGGSGPDWFRAARWWRGREFGTKFDQNPSPGGGVIHFVSGGFWCAKTEALIAGDVPDERLHNNGGDITIGEQVRQAGYQVVAFNKDKVFVTSSDAGRRGVEHVFPWAEAPGGDKIAAGTEA